MLTWHKVFISGQHWRQKCGHCYNMYGIEKISNLAETISGLQQFCGRHGGWVVSVLDSRLEGLGSSPGRVIALCSWARHFTLTVALSTQVYKWVPAKCQGKLTKFWGITCDGLASHPGRVAILYSYLIHATKAGISSGCVGRWFGLLFFFTEQF